MATPSSILAWEIPWTEEPGGLQSKESDTIEQLTLHTSLPVVGKTESQSSISLTPLLLFCWVPGPIGFF